MKSLPIVITALFLLPFLAVPSLDAQCNAKYRFVNNTGREVTDLHIEFENPPEKLESYNFPGRPSTGKADYLGPNSNGTDNRWDIVRGRLPNKGVATLCFTSNGPPPQIRRWWWTVDDSPATEPFNNERRSGTNASGASLDRDLVAPGETVTKITLHQPYTKRNDRGQKVRIGINDLHIVTTKPPTVLNKTKKSENATPKAGGIFEKESVTTCECGPPRGQPLPPICRKVCDGQTGTLYVLNLVTEEEVLKYGRKVELELKGVEKDDLEWLWWTKDSYPYTGTWDNPDRGSRGEGVPEEKGRSVPGEPKEEWEEVVGNFGRPGNSRSTFAVGVFGGIGASPFEASVDFGPQTTPELMNALYADPDVMAQLFEAFGGEVFLGDFSGLAPMEVEAQPATTQFGAHLRFGLTDQLSLDARGSFSQANAEGRFPVMVFPWSPETTEEFYETSGTYRLERSVQEFSLGANYLLGSGPLRAGIGGYTAAQRVSNRSTVIMGGQRVGLSDSADFALSAQLRGIIHYQPVDRLFLEGGLVRSFQLSEVPLGEVTTFQLGIGFYLGQ